jgi:hypothetical protein
MSSGVAARIDDGAGQAREAVGGVGQEAAAVGEDDLYVGVLAHDTVQHHVERGAGGVEDVVGQRSGGTREQGHRGLGTDVRSTATCCEGSLHSRSRQREESPLHGTSAGVDGGAGGEQGGHEDLGSEDARRVPGRDFVGRGAGDSVPERTLVARRDEPVLGGHDHRGGQA